MEQVVDRVVTKLLSMLDPTGVMAVVNGFIAFFNAVQSVVEYIREILQIIDDYVSTVAAIARGDVEPSATKVEQGLADAVPVAIGFLANQVGLGDIGSRIAEMIAGLRELVDRALDWLLDQAIRAGLALLRSLGLVEEEEPADSASELTDEEREALYGDVRKRIGEDKQIVVNGAEAGEFLISRTSSGRGRCRSSLSRRPGPSPAALLPIRS